MANGRRHGNRDTQFEPEHFEVRAIDLDPSAGGLHQGAQPSCCRPDAVYMAATDQLPDPNKALAPREPSIHGSSPMASRTVEASHLPVRQTLAMLGIPSTTYYRPLSADLPCKSPAGQWDMTDGRKAGLARSRAGRPARALYGTASRMRPVPTSSSLRWNMRI